MQVTGYKFNGNNETIESNSRSLFVRGVVYEADQPVKKDGCWYQKVRLDVAGTLSSETVPLKHFLIDQPECVCAPGLPVLVEYAFYSNVYGIPVVLGVQPIFDFDASGHRKVPMLDQLFLTLSSRPPHRADRCIHKTRFGDRVFSKSEIVVSEIMKSHGIPFQYELTAKSKIEGTVRYPDWVMFTHEGNPVFLEHLGMLGNDEYQQKWLPKVYWYARHGVHYGVNLFTTRDEDNGGLDCAAIETTCLKIKSLIEDR